MRLRGTGIGFSIALTLFACTGKVVPLGHGTGTTQGALGEPPLSNGTCDQGLTACSGICVDTTGDRANCGGCGVACGVDAVCTAGQCTLTTLPDTECSLADVGALCSDNTTCIPATCCDDPNGCASDVDAGNGAGSGSSGGSSSSSGGNGPAPTGVSRACAICELTGGTYCAPSQNGMACPGGGVCGMSGGGGGGIKVTTLDGGVTTASFSFITCGDTGGSGDGGAGSSSSGSTNVGGSTSGGGTNGSGMSSSGSSGGTNGSGMSGGGSGSSSSSGG